MSIELDNLRRDESALRKELESAGAHFKGRACLCVFHPDKHPSAGIYCKDGVWKFCCQVCKVQGDIVDIRARLNKRTVAEELRAMNPTTARPMQQPKIYPSITESSRTLPNVQRIYTYTNPDTKQTDLAVIRFIDPETGKKSMRQVSPAPGGWWMKAPPGPMPLYGRARIRTAGVVIVVEGEKCVEWALTGIPPNYAATTSPMGAGKAKLADWSPLAGKVVYLWPDNDQPGLEHMREVRAILQNLTPRPTIHWIHPDELDLPEKGDVADYLEPYAPNERQTALEAVLGNAEAMGSFADYSKELTAVREGKRKSLPFGPWALTTTCTHALMPEMVTTVCGDPGCGKSLLVMEAMVCWFELGIKACIYELEDSQVFHMRRAHAQAASEAGITNNDWVERNGTRYVELELMHRERLQELGDRIYTAPPDQASLEMLLVWAEQRAKAGYEIICIDPVTAAATDEKPWIADLKFINKLKQIGRQYGCRFVLVTHPRKGGKASAGIHDTAGGSAYPRFTQTVLWVERNDANEEFTVKEHPCLPGKLVIPNRILRITKARNGHGSGKRIAIHFDAQTLCFKELGMIENV